MFVWREAKRQKVIADHNVDFSLITDIFDVDFSVTDIFDDPFTIYNDDLGHSETEPDTPLSE